MRERILVVDDEREICELVAVYLEAEGFVVECLGDGAAALARVRDDGVPAIDLAVISAVLSSNMDAAIGPEVCMAGEVGLSGEIRPVNRIEQRIGEAEKLGFRRFILPRQNLQGLDTAKKQIELIPVRKVEEAFRVLFG